MKKLIMLMLCLLVAGAAQAIPVADNFTDGELDASTWIPVVKDGSEVLEYPGYLTMTQVDARPYMATVGGWDPTTQGTLTVTTTAYIPAGKGIVIWTRSNGEYDTAGWPNMGGVIGTGLRFSFMNNQYNTGIMYKAADGAAWAGVSSLQEDTSNLTYGVAGDWNITVTDTGSEVTLEVVNVADPSNYAIATANISDVPAVTSHKVAVNGFGVEFDNLYINSANPAASQPTPADGAEDVAIDTDLSWTAPEAYTQDGCRVYFGTNEPNYSLANYGLTELTNGVEDITTISPSPSPMANGTTYYWIVDSYEPGVTEPFLGDAWSFTTIPALPAIDDATPTGEALFAGEDAVFTVEFVSESAITSNVWEKSTDGGASWTTAPGTVTLDEASTPNTSELTIAGVTAADEAMYRCVLTNSAGSEASEPANLILKTLKAHWTMDQSDFSNNTYLDVSGYGHDATKVGTTAPTFVTDADGNATGAVGIFTSDQASTAGTWDPTAETGEFTIHAWVKWDGVTRGGLLSKRTGWSVDGMMFHTTVNADGTVSIARRGTWDITRTSTKQVTANEWNKVAIAFDGSNVRFYINGLWAGTSDFSLGTGTGEPITIGALRGDGLVPFGGYLDNVKLYNYALPHEDLVDAPVYPSPADNATGVPFDTDLSWYAGEGSELFDVYYSTTAPDLDAPDYDPNYPLTDPSVIAGLTSPEASFGFNLDLDTTYYWYVVESDGSGNPLWQSDVWRFTTRDLKTDLTDDLRVDMYDLEQLATEWLTDTKQFPPSEYAYLDHENWADPNFPDQEPQLTDYVAPWEGDGTTWAVGSVELNFSPTPADENHDPGNRTMVWSYDDSEGGWAHGITIGLPQDVDFSEFDKFGYWVYQESTSGSADIRIDSRNDDGIYRDWFDMSSHDGQWHKYVWDIPNGAATAVYQIRFYRGDASGATEEFSDFFLIKDDVTTKLCLNEYKILDEDINDDCVVDFLDFVYLAQDWLLDASNL
ncbi:hypothetical protein STSP2_03242 [Anaerohalosphaera lusitana]|uniref:Ig-like domain-containing protein n=1 Tax=Anaerohalosphaera lusitana TaxID=1936003 RepID=A0A1U9NQZ3_9BACT|nr:LamG-like jellyroll fold domain-containing protein [Anaerohalosphaera lusitana]AQT70040.1 hypothetical protein STSP2_03242 [Anaerohalosphaera lusitana]